MPKSSNSNEVSMRSTHVYFKVRPSTLSTLKFQILATMNRPSHCILVPWMLLIFSLSSLLGCEKTGQRNGDTPTNAPQILKFEASATHIQAGEVIHLRWQVKNATKIELLPSTQTLEAEGELAFSPASSTIYELSASSANGEKSRFVLSVDVTQKSPEKKAYPILFVTQVPPPRELNSRLAAFANHLTSPQLVPRGGDLMIRYPNGKIRNLTQLAQLGESGQQGRGAIAVREPAVHWDGEKALVSLLIGTPTEKENNNHYFWQIYEVQGLAESETPDLDAYKNKTSRAIMCRQSMEAMTASFSHLTAPVLAKRICIRN